MKRVAVIVSFVLSMSAVSCVANGGEVHDVVGRWREQRADVPGGEDVMWLEFYPDGRFTHAETITDESLSRAAPGCAVRQEGIGEWQRPDGSTRAAVFFHLFTLFDRRVRKSATYQNVRPPKSFRQEERHTGENAVEVRGVRLELLRRAVVAVGTSFDGIPQRGDQAARATEEKRSRAMLKFVQRQLVVLLWAFVGAVGCTDSDLDLRDSSLLVDAGGDARETPAEDTFARDVQGADRQVNLMPDVSENDADVHDSVTLDVSENDADVYDSAPPDAARADVGVDAGARSTPPRGVWGHVPPAGALHPRHRSRCPPDLERAR